MSARRTQPDTAKHVFEAELKADILYALARRTDMRAWNNPTGFARTLDGKRTVHFGVTGQADISGILSGGRRLEIEVKTPSGPQSKEQKAFQAMIERFGGLYILARSVRDVEAAL